MLPSKHIMLGAIFTVLLLIIFPQISLLGGIIIFLSSFLIDVDHYLYYSIKYKDWNLKHSYAWFIQKSAEWKKLAPKQKEKYERSIFIFHGIECWLVLILLIYINPIFGFVLIGFFIHTIFDFIDLYARKESLLLKTSQVYVYKRNKKMKNINNHG